MGKCRCWASRTEGDVCSKRVSLLGIPPGWCFSPKGAVALPRHQGGLPRRNALEASLDSRLSEASELVRGSLRQQVHHFYGI